MPARIVVIESPYGSTDKDVVAENVSYARRCVADSISRGECPFASHLLYTQVLDDNNPADRARGINLNLEMIQWAAECIAVYTDRGISRGMKEAAEHAEHLNIPIEYRKLDGE